MRELNKKEAKLCGKLLSVPLSNCSASVLLLLLYLQGADAGAQQEGD
jgi:hypothetical protein